MKSIRIVIHKDEVLNDIIGIAHVTGRRISTPETLEKAADIQTPEEGPDKYIVARAMSTAIGNVKLKCARYLNAGRLSDENALESMEGDFILDLSMPDTWNFAATSMVCSSIHNYMVDFCLYSILGKTNPNEAAVYLEKAVEGLQDIKGTLELRTSSLRRPCKRLY